MKVEYSVLQHPHELYLLCHLNISECCKINYVNYTTGPEKYNIFSFSLTEFVEHTIANKTE